jgi:hypothetical protein
MAQGTRMQADQNLLSTISSWVQHAPTTVLSPEILDFVHALDTAVVRSSSSTIDEIGLLRQVEQNQSRFAGAISLLDFLRIVIAERGDESVEIHVIGHSKGGPLAAALSLWLADTQGPEIPHAEQWDSKRRAVISVYTFAAPTPGNSAFASHFAKMIKNDYRLANPLDIVPHVWNAAEARDIPNLYKGQLRPLKGLVDALTPTLRQLDYCHEVPASEAGWTPQIEDLQLPGQIAFQHLDAYLKKFDLFSEMNFVSLFQPLSA